ncbi:DNA helicase [Trifolium repens]|nr:DNA helicase [Trifolium repens]
MEEFFHFENLTPHGGFTTAWLANQPFGEVDPTFYADFMDELDEEWKIMDYRYTSHTVKCNKDLIFPLLKEAWTEMKDVFGFTDQQDITLFYYGNNLFGIISSKPLQEYGHLPIYHSHAYLPGHTSHFCVRLTTDINDKPFMNIFCEFEDFIRNSNINYMNVCCANGAT